MCVCVCVSECPVGTRCPGEGTAAYVGCVSEDMHCDGKVDCRRESEEAGCPYGGCSGHCSMTSEGIQCCAQ